MTEKIVDYIKSKYRPDTLMVYGSYADGSNNENSDFDALAIGKGLPISHDDSLVLGVKLDLFLYPTEHFTGGYDIQDFAQIHDGRIVLDSGGLGRRLVEEAKAYVESFSPKPADELAAEVSWCEKMCLRAERGDTEGFYRWHWLLVDSLEIYFDVIGRRFLGPKKGLKWMREHDERGFALYHDAVADLSGEALGCWVACLRSRLDHRQIP